VRSNQTIAFRTKVVSVLVALIAIAMVALLGACGGSNTTTTETASGNGTTATTAPPTAEPVTWTMGHMGAADFVYQLVGEVLRDELDERTGGMVILQIKGAGALGDESGTLELYKSGDMQVGVHISGAVGALFPQFGFLSTPFLFDSEEHWAAVQQSDEGHAYWNGLLEENNAAFRVGAIACMGARNLYSKDPVATIDDLQGLKLRIVENPVASDIWKAIGSVPIALPFSEVYSALQTGMINAADNSPTGYTHFSHQEVAKNYLETEHEYSTAFMFVSKEAYDALSPELQEQVDAAFMVAQESWLGFREEQDAEIIANFDKWGVVVTQPSSQLIQDIKTRIQPVIDKTVEAQGMQGFMELVEAKRK